MARGIIDTSYIDFPDNIDTAYLRGLTMRSGLSFTQLAARLDAGLGRINAGIDPVLATLLAPPTTNVTAAGGRTSRMVAERRSEYTIARPQLVERTAHMLSVDEFEIALGFTEDGLQEISLDGFDAQVEGMVEGFEALHRAEILARLFGASEIPVDPKLKTNATSPGFAGSGTGGNVFNTLYPDGTSLPGGYTHYFRDTSGNLDVLVKTMRNRIMKWHTAPFDLIGSQNIIDAIAALPDFVSAGSALIRTGVGDAEALVDATRYVGVYDKNIRVLMAVNDFTTDHFAVFKSYGAMNARNPLIWRYDQNRGMEAIVRSRQLFPLALSTAIQKFGVNVNDRVGAAVAYVAAGGSYTPPALLY